MPLGNGVPLVVEEILRQAHPLTRYPPAGKWETGTDVLEKK